MSESMLALVLSSVFKLVVDRLLKVIGWAVIGGMPAGSHPCQLVGLDQRLLPLPVQTVTGRVSTKLHFTAVLVVDWDTIAKVATPVLLL